MIRAHVISKDLIEARNRRDRAHQACQAGKAGRASQAGQASWAGQTSQAREAGEAGRAGDAVQASDKKEMHLGRQASSESTFEHRGHAFGSTGVERDHI